MPTEDERQKSGPQFHKPQPDPGKGMPFVDPLAGPGTSSGYRFIDAAKMPEPQDDGDIRGDERRGTVLDTRAPIKGASDNRVKKE